MIAKPRLAIAMAFSLCAAAAPAVAAPPADPAAARVDALCNGVLQAVRQAGAGAQARARKIQPAVSDGFNLAVMAQFVVGPAWSKMSAADQAAVVAALSHYTAARYAQEFDSYNGQRCVVDPAAQTRGPDKLVKSQIVGGGEAQAVNYRLREYGGAWKAIDVYYNEVSQVATERADFAGVLQAGGAGALVAKLNELSAKIR
ncbi:MAG: hopanoid biosynthesis protein HpnM [Phenylobacterium sp.]|nr:hopanoid biosynthesis protein HpnM [Phenylobacterium sp.]